MDYYSDPETEYVEIGKLGSLDERAQAVREATSLVADIRPHLPFLGKTKPLEDDAKRVYAAGKLFRVIKPGARLEGIVQFGKVKAGYAESLEVGDIIEATGWREGLCGGGVMEANFRTEGSPDNALWLQFWPFQSLWSPWPLKGWLEEYDPTKPEPKAEPTCGCPRDIMTCEECESYDG